MIDLPRTYNNQIYTKAVASSTVPPYHPLTKKRERIVLMASSTSKSSHFVTFVTFPVACQQRLLKEKQARMGAGEKRGPQNLAPLIINLEILGIELINNKSTISYCQSAS
jgi:hypothetical protein